MTITGHIEISFKREENYIYQIIHIIPNATKNLHYFIRDKYILGRKVNDFLMTKYIGDGINIIFIEDNKFRNMNTIKYEVRNEMSIDLTAKKYFIKGDIPSTDSCSYCKYMRGGTPMQVQCMLYKKFLKSKIFCIDFYEK